MALWSKTSTAVNNGYGMIQFGTSSLPNPTYHQVFPLGASSNPYSGRIHPELLMEPPYAQKTRGAGLRNPSPSQIERSRRNPTIHMAVAPKKVLRGGNAEFLSTLFESLSGTAINALKRIALDTGASITELLANPSELMEKAITYGPRVVSAVKSIISLFNGKKRRRKKVSKEAKMREFMRRKRQREMMRKLLASQRKGTLMDDLFGEKENMEDEFDFDEAFNDFAPSKRRRRKAALSSIANEDTLIDDTMDEQLIPAYTKTSPSQVSPGRKVIPSIM